ncbi:MAG: sugar ABC transporter ATP-binding protein [Sphaerochaetaceae bacterium]|nr:sugar ABC transporter ATP-binding protein [Sphaerochaetaceae bacterium]
MNNLLLEMNNINKSFPGVQALKDVSLNLKKGEVHALLGENGAGKSTLIKILGGIYRADNGTIKIEGIPQKINSIKHAKDCGISIIHQELMIVPEMTVASNIYLGKYLKHKKIINDKKMFEESQKMLDSFFVDIKSTDKLGDLNIANQQMVEIIRAVSFGAKIIVMDEPTSSLTEKEVDILFKTIKKLKKQNIGIIYISHRMNELNEIADRVTVLRDGEYIDTVNVKGTSREQLINMMVGRELVNFYTKNSIPSKEKILEVKNLNDGDLVKDVSFDLYKGEILGFAGLVGAGRSETMKALFGLSNIQNGKIIFDNNIVSINDPKKAINLGIALVPEDRKKEGLYLDKDIIFNTSIEVLGNFIKGIRVDKKKEREIVSKYSKSMNVKTPTLNQLISKLSGGNQQKVIIGRWLATNPRILILDEPTRGIDVGAKAEIYNLINELAKNGIGIIFISSELPEIINMSDRVAVMNHGVIKTILEKDFTQEQIMYYATL